jgi:UPF0271 protein
MRIDLNGDVGEASSRGAAGRDSSLMSHITSANVACGFHAGNPEVMRATVILAREHGVAVGAHPGFPDPDGFGRRELKFAAPDVEDFVAYQIGSLAAIAAAEGVRLQHIKPHGALFNMAVRSAELSDAIGRAAVGIDRSLILVGLPGSEIVAAGKRAGLRTASEGYADRAYQPDGTLVPRDHAGAVIDDPERVVPRAVWMVQHHEVEAADGRCVPLMIDTLCLHGDTPGAANLAGEIRAAFDRAGTEVKAIGLE